MNRRAMVLAALVAACSYDSPLHSVTFPFQVEGLQIDPTTQQARVPDASLTFQAGAIAGEIPWTVTLTTAEIALGPIYFYNVPATTTTEASEGRVVSQVLAAFDVDALDPTPFTTTPGGNGDNEEVYSVSVWLTEDQTGAISTVAGPGVAVMHAAGTALRTIQQGGQNVMQTVPFDGVLQFPVNVTPYQNALAHHGETPWQVNAHDQNTGFTPDNGGTLTLQVDPTHWFDNVNFEQIASQGVAPYGFTNITQQLESTVVQFIDFTFTWTSPDT